MNTETSTVSKPEFKPFDKIPRLKRDCFITEKLDGTNASITITEDGQFLCGSRNRWITPEDDNYGFARWAHTNKEELLKLGVGTHYGEWWGNGIQRTYGKTDKEFSLFNVGRWNEMYEAHLAGHTTNFPVCCSVVPVLFKGVFADENIKCVLAKLVIEGSVAAKGFQRPEGIVVYHIASKLLFKVTLENDESPKELIKK